MILSLAVYAATFFGLLHASRRYALRRGIELNVDRSLVVLGCSGLALTIVSPNTAAAALGGAVAFAAVALAAWTDLHSGYVFDACTTPATVVALALALFTNDPGAHLLGVACCAGPLLVLRAATRGRGLGLGDVKLAALIGCAFGPFSGAVALGIAFVAGAAIALFLLAKKLVTRDTPVPFAPFLAAGVAAATLSGAIIS